MSAHKFKKLGPRDVREVCVSCNKNPQKRIGSTIFYKPICSQCDKKRSLNKPQWRKSYRKYKTNVCAKCGFTSEHRCQFDVDHKDGNHHNNDPNNLETLCSNCHRLKTYLNQEWKQRTPKDL